MEHFVISHDGPIPYPIIAMLPLLKNNNHTEIIA